MGRIRTLILAVAATAISIVALSALMTFPYWDDDYCITRTEGPSATREEGTGITSRLSIFPPKMICIYDTPNDGRIEIEHSLIG